MDSGKLIVEEKDKGNADEDRFSASVTLNSSNPPETENSDPLEQRLLLCYISAEQVKEDKDHARIVSNDTDYSEGQKENDVTTGSKQIAGDICPTETDFQNSGCITDSIKYKDEQNLLETMKNMPPSDEENKQTIEDLVAPQKESVGESNMDTPTATTDSKSDVESGEEKTQTNTEPSLHLNSTQSAASLEGNKQTVSENLIVQKPSVHSKKALQPGVSPDGPIKDIDQQNLNESRKNMLPSDEKKLYDEEHTTENRQTLEDSVAQQKESVGESNKDTPTTTTESKSDVESREENMQTKTEPSLHLNSTPSAASLKGNKQTVPENLIVQKPSVHSKTELQPSVSPDGPIKDIDQQNLNESRRNMPASDEKKLYDEEHTTENRQTIEDSVAPQKESVGESNKVTPTTTIESKSDVKSGEDKIQTKTEPTLHPSSTPSAAFLERNKQIVNETLIIQKTSVRSKKAIQPSVSPEGIKDIDEQNINESWKNMPLSDDEKLHDIEQPAENSQTRKDLLALNREYHGESNKDTPATTIESENDVEFREKKKPNLNTSYMQSGINSERDKEIATEKENEQKTSGQYENEFQHTDSPEDPKNDKLSVQKYKHDEWLRKRHAAGKSVLDKDQLAASQTTEPIEELGAICVEEEQFLGEIREKKGSVWNVASVAAGVVLLFLFLYLYCFGSTPSSDSTPVMKFLKEFEKLKAEFPGQNDALWLRSSKMLQKHLNKSQPLEPATLILTAAQDGEHTLRCLSIGLARAYATSLNSSWNLIDGPSKAAYDSTTTKLQVDETLSSGFESTCRAAVLHRIEELSPGSLLILYKYCDHENAVFKNVALVITVLLKQSTLKSDQTLTEVEEGVKDFLWEKCISRGSGNSYNEMNVDKMSGVWSRISHLVLPVYPVESLESGSCPWSELKEAQN